MRKVGGVNVSGQGGVGMPQQRNKGQARMVMGSEDKNKVRLCCPCIPEGVGSSRTPVLRFKELHHEVRVRRKVLTAEQ